MNEEIIEYSAGGILIDKSNKALIIRVRNDGYEFPKGHIEANESMKDAAIRELMEETGLKSPVYATDRLGELEYSFISIGKLIRKKVVYFLMEPANQEILEFSKRPKNTREIKWINNRDLKAISFVNENLKGIITLAFEIWKNKNKTY